MTRHSLSTVYTLFFNRAGFKRNILNVIFVVKAKVTKSQYEEMRGTHLLYLAIIHHNTLSTIYKSMLLISQRELDAMLLTVEHEPSERTFTYSPNQYDR